jgi:hypothetical protein
MTSEPNVTFLATVAPKGGFIIRIGISLEKQGVKLVSNLVRNMEGERYIQASQVLSTVFTYRANNSLLNLNQKIQNGGLVGNRFHFINCEPPKY